MIAFVLENHRIRDKYVQKILLHIQNKSGYIYLWWRKKERPNFDRMFSQNLPISAAFIAILKMKLSQCKAIGVRTPPGVRRTSPFRLQIFRLVSRDFWCKQSAKVQTLSPVRSVCVGNFSNITSHFREAFPPSKLSSFFYHIFECLSSKFLFRCRRSWCEECYRMRCGME